MIKPRLGWWVKVDSVEGGEKKKDLHGMALITKKTKKNATL